MSESSAQPPPPRLNSWKAIADYLGVTTRTAQNWEADRGLPVHRLPGGRGTVWAMASELDAWKTTGISQSAVSGLSDTNRRFLRGRRGAALIVVSSATAVATVAVGLFLLFRPGPPAFWQVRISTLIASDVNGREVWRRTFEENLLESWYNQAHVNGRNQAWIGDVDGDGEREVLFTLHFLREGAESGSLVCLSRRGEERWRFTPGRPVKTATRHFSSHFRTMKFAVAPLLQTYPMSILVISYNYPDYPTQVVLLTPGGKPVREYWHSGAIGADLGDTESLRIADLNGDGQNEIYLAGVNNAHHQATLVALDPKTMGGASVEEDRAYQLQGFEPGREIGRVLFQRSCINRKVLEYNGGYELTVDGPVLSVSVMEEMDPPTSSVFYKFDAGLHLLSSEPSDSFRSRHLRMYSLGQLDHPLSDAELAEMSRIRVFRSADLAALP